MWDVLDIEIAILLTACYCVSGIRYENLVLNQDNTQGALP